MALSVDLMAHLHSIHPLGDSKEFQVLGSFVFPVNPVSRIARWYIERYDKWGPACKLN